MRFVTNLMLVASLVFVFIFLQDHYDVTARIWHYWYGGAPQPNGPAAPANPGTSALPADHDYQLVIDVSGKGPFMTVVHGPIETVKKVTKKSKKTVADPPAQNQNRQQTASQSQPALPPQITAPPSASTQPVSAPPSGTKAQ